MIKIIGLALEVAIGGVAISIALIAIGFIIYAVGLSLKRKMKL